MTTPEGEVMRFLNRLYAFVFGYFWLPCPICNRMYGGHESVWPNFFSEVDDTYNRSVCSAKCANKAQELAASRGPILYRGGKIKEEALTEEYGNGGACKEIVVEYQAAVAAEKAVLEKEDTQ